MRQLGHYEVVVVKSYFRSRFLWQAKPRPSGKSVQGEIQGETELYGRRLVVEYEDRCVQRCYTPPLVRTCSRLLYGPVR